MSTLSAQPLRISVIGTGYLGATHAICMASIGHDVIAVDVDPAKIAALEEGRVPFFEPGLSELLGDVLATGRLRFTTDPAEAAAHADIHFICVGTPQTHGSDAADLTYVHAAVTALAPHLRPGALVVGKSTVPLGTAAELTRQVTELAPCDDVALAWNPEFLREGRAVRDSLEPDRLVLGVESDEDLQVLKEVYADLLGRGVPVIRTDLATAELAKVSANAMLAARVSLVNLLAEVCEVSGADVGDLTEVLRTDPRIGRDFLSPGLGYGGGCLPKDTRAFVARAQELGVDESTALLEAVDAVNLRQRARTTALALDLLDRPPAAATVAVLGGAFKAGSDDVRDSPALDVACRVRRAGARVRVHDPRAGDNVRRIRPELDVADDVRSACRGADLVLVLTEWPEFASIDPVELGDLVARRTVLDARLVLDPDKWTAAGWDFRALGRGGPGQAPAARRSA